MAYSAEALAKLVRGTYSGPAGLEISTASRIETAGEGSVTFLANPRYFTLFEETAASLVIVPEDFTSDVVKPIIRAKNPYYAFALVLQHIYPPPRLVETGIHETAIIGTGTVLGKNVAIGPYAVIGSNCEVGDNTVLFPFTVIADGARVGADCVIHSHVSVRELVRIGDRVIIHDGTVIGSDGFGFAPEGGVYHKIPQVGTVIIGDDVEIGANTTIDRATMGETVIEQGVKLDNLIQVAHNCRIGEHSVIAAQTGLSGSTMVGKNARIGGQVGFAGHMRIGENVIIAAQSGVSKDVPDGVMVSGTPALPHRSGMRIQAAVRQLPDLLKEFKQLKERIAQLEADKREK
ncbi:UDP-3-O-(3-hydroxymyristoyl)glucosamine N-acyltransferase [bacterium]|nr:UDP-3-O-(3-hydroxymyristoyl)glucosamine N-acyltransferase [bacterium]